MSKYDIPVSEIDPQHLSMWSRLREHFAEEELREVVLKSAPQEVLSMTHLSTAHYVVYKVFCKSRNYIARIGIHTENDYREVENDGYLDTNTFQPTGQTREVKIAHEFSKIAPNNIIVPSKLEYISFYDITWSMYYEKVSSPLTAYQWRDVLNRIHSLEPKEIQPHFTNRVKSFARVDTIESMREKSTYLKDEYDEKMRKLFDTATNWSMVHGDAHAGNALNTSSGLKLYDFDTSCYAPSVWDITHLMLRAGTGENTGYKVRDIANAFSHFSNREIHAAIQLRKVAAKIARNYHELS